VRHFVKSTSTLTRRRSRLRRQKVEFDFLSIRLHIAIVQNVLICVSFSTTRMLLRELTPTEAANKLPSSPKCVDVSRNSVCRCLFGRPPSDVSAIRAYLDDSSRRRWNFDFAAMQPLPAGRFEWTVSCAADILPVPVTRSTDTSLAVAADSPECKISSPASSTTNNITTDNDFQFSSVNCRLPGPCSTTLIPLSGNRYALFHFALN